MNQGTPNGRPARAMREMVTALRGEQPPELDWSAVEAGIQARLARELVWRRDGASAWQRRAWLGASALAAAAAALALVVVGQPLSDLSSAPQAGEVVVAGGEPTRVSLPGGGHWTLAPDSRAVIGCGGPPGRVCADDVDEALRAGRGGLGRARGAAQRAPYVVVLEQGALDADVEPGLAADGGLLEPFVVAAGGVRVAVHGTRFSVRREAAEVIVAVRRGAVTVGPLGHRGLTTGHLLIAPARAAFSIEDGRVARLLPAPAPPAVAGRRDGTPAGAAALKQGAAAGAEPAAAPAGAPDEPAPPDSALAEQPARPSGQPLLPDGSAEHLPAPAREGAAAPPEQPGPMALADARARMASCLADALSRPSQPGGAVKVTVSSIVRLRLDGDLRIVSLQFAPPLKPELQQRCAGTLLGRRLADAAERAEFRIELSTP